MTTATPTITARVTLAADYTRAVKRIAEITDSYRPLTGLFQKACTSAGQPVPLDTGLDSGSAYLSLLGTMAELAERAERAEAKVDELTQRAEAAEGKLAAIAKVVE